MTLNAVVLPAPFGPIRPEICPASTSNETPSRATMPPKRKVISRTDSKSPLNRGAYCVATAVQGLRDVVSGSRGAQSAGEADRRRRAAPLRRRRTPRSPRAASTFGRRRDRAGRRRRRAARRRSPRTSSRRSPPRCRASVARSGGTGTVTSARRRDRPSRFRRACRARSCRRERPASCARRAPSSGWSTPRVWAPSERRTTAPGRLAAVAVAAARNALARRRAHELDATRDGVADRGAEAGRQRRDPGLQRPPVGRRRRDDDRVVGERDEPDLDPRREPGRRTR